MAHLPQQIVRHLALIKYMFQAGVEESRRPSPFFVRALLSFQDSAELFLHLACEHHQIPVPKQAQFLEYWGLLKSKGPVGHQPGMDRLNRARVNFKHHGNLPNAQDMEDFRATAATFFEDSTPLLFGVKFDEVSLVDLVEHKEAREQLQEAHRCWNTNAADPSVQNCLALALAHLLSGYQRDARDGSWTSFVTIAPSMSPLSTSRLRGQDKELAKFLERTSDSIDSLNAAVSIMALGLDYRRYTRFRTLTPTVSWAKGGPASYRWPRSLPLKAEDFQFATDFIIEAAVRLQES
jgi:hypothetical protein